MKPEAEAHIGKAAESLRKASASLAAIASVPEMAENAARDAYYAAFHTAKALIFERTGKTHKTHSGVHTEFIRITRDEASLDRELRSFLIKAYAYKAAADYETSRQFKIDHEIARTAIEKAKQFVEAITALLGA